jgi:hypothetical protein
LAIILVLIAFMAVPIWLLWRIFGRAGLSKGFAFLVLIPYAGPFIALAILAFSRWPSIEAVAFAGSAPVPAPPFVPAPPAPPSTPALPPGWQPDPTGEHRLRYWDGVSWTENVSE